MTCIVGIIDRKNKEIIVGGDSAGVSGIDIAKRRDTKVFIKDNRFLIGFTSSFRMGQILHYSDLYVPEQEECEDELAFMIKKFVPAVITLFEKHNWGQKYTSGDARGGTFIVGYKDKMFQVMDDFQVEESYKCYTACGCGESYALGSFFSSTHLTQAERVAEALRCAEEFSGGVSSPFVIKKLKFI